MSRINLFEHYSEAGVTSENNKSHKHTKVSKLLQSNLRLNKYALRTVIDCIRERKGTFNLIKDILNISSVFISKGTGLALDDSSYIRFAPLATNFWWIGKSENEFFNTLTTNGLLLKTPIFHLQEVVIVKLTNNLFSHELNAYESNQSGNEIEISEYAVAKRKSIALMHGLEFETMGPYNQILNLGVSLGFITLSGPVANTDATNLFKGFVNMNKISTLYLQYVIGINNKYCNFQIGVFTTLLKLREKGAPRVQQNYIFQSININIKSIIECIQNKLTK